jgi:hypothetical protein
MAKTLLRRANDELSGMSEVVTSSGPDWTIVRFLAPKNGPARGRLRQGFFGTDRLGFAVTRTDIAAFAAAQVDDPRYVGAAPSRTNPNAVSRTAEFGSDVSRGPARSAGRAPGACGVGAVPRARPAVDARRPGGGAGILSP